MDLRTFLLVWVTWNHFTLISGEPLCSSSPQFETGGTVKDVWGRRGFSVQLNCSILLSFNNSECAPNVQWSKDGEPLSKFTQNTSHRVIVDSILTVSLKEDVDFGLYTCKIWNSTITFRLQSSFSPNHIGAIVASAVLLLVCVLAAGVYTKCHLNFKLWYKNSYGDYEMNDGKMYDAFISYINTEDDRKFVNFILKPHLDNKLGHKLFLNDTDILPGAEPSADLLMNISRCRRLIVVLSQTYIEQEWCTSNFRQGFLHLLELSHKPIFILFQSQQKHVNVDIINQLRLHQARITTLIWGAHSMTPSSRFWKELTLVMPRKVVFHSKSAGDPQTLLQCDKDPMLTVQPDYFDCRQDPDPAGDLGLQKPFYKAMTSRHPVLPVVTDPVIEVKAPDIDMSDLGSRDYAARTDFYCLVTEDDI